MTILLTGVLPRKTLIGSSRLPVEYANVHNAYADLSSHPVSSLCRPVKLKKEGKKSNQIKIKQNKQNTLMQRLKIFFFFPLSIKLDCEGRKQLVLSYKSQFQNPR